MQRTANILTAVTLVAALGAGAAIASNKNAYKLPDEVHASSIKLPENTETQAEFAKYASVTQKQAEAAALAVQPGKVVQARLDDEDGYLVWQIAVHHARGTTEFAVDAGNAKVLAAEAGDGEHEGRDDGGERG
jgi:uncharacterized membrane protein YkoI